MKPAALARITLVDATVTATLIDEAVINLELGLSGWPEQVPGASPASAAGTRECPRKDCNRDAPCPEHNPDGLIRLTITEKLGLTPDRARRDLEALAHAVRVMAHHAREAAKICSSWQLGLNDDEITNRLVTIDAQIWCENCSRYGRHEPRKQGKTECDFCDGFRERRFKRTGGGLWQAPPKEIWDARDARNGRLDETTITRILKGIEEQRRADGANRKATERAAKQASKMSQTG